ncbi:glycosyltransferase [Paenibacillus thailandensis]|uniref:Glycosyltransferase n=1 Tax=Paenibacillus thailandensis TaxID=393250 RepID=A0ABW5R374_9BACL
MGQTQLKVINQSKPITSIIILTHNQIEYTKLCIESIRKYTEKDTYEIIIIDNNSTDGTKDWLQEQDDLQLILNDYNAGFPAGCNQGIEIANGDNILLLNNDTIVTENWLTNLRTALTSSNDIGAVGPITNSASYYQTIPTSYKSIADMHNFASSLNVSNPAKWECRLKLIGFCMLIKREVIDKIGLLDERFTPGNYEDDDYSFRIVQEGYKLLLCKDTFIHHFGGASFKHVSNEYINLMTNNAKKFIQKWGFNSTYSSMIRFEIINLIDSPQLEPIRVLEVGCACGATLLEIKNQYPNAELYGIELNASEANIAGKFANVEAEDVEMKLSYPESFFDYMIFADVLQHLHNPWQVVENVKKYLKPNGKLLISLPNVMHYSVLRELLDGKWTYRDAGILDRRHLRFFTRQEMLKMLEDAGYTKIEIGATNLPVNEIDAKLISDLAALTDYARFEEETKAYQYLFRVHNLQEYNRIEQLLKSINEFHSIEAIDELADLIVSNDSLFTHTRNEIFNYPDCQNLFNMIAISMYNKKLYDYVLPLLQDSLSVNEQDDDTLYNIGYVLYQSGEFEIARSYLKKIRDKDEHVMSMIGTTHP